MSPCGITRSKIMAINFSDLQKQNLRVCLGSHHPAEMPGGKAYTSRSDLTDYPQYTSETMDDTQNFIPEVFIKAVIDIGKPTGMLLGTVQERARLLRLGLKVKQIELAFIIANNLEILMVEWRDYDVIR